MYERFCDVIGRPEWKTKPEWRTQKGRSRDRAAINAAIGDITRTQTADYWINMFDEAGIPCGPIYTIDQVFADPQVQHLGMATLMHRSDAAGGDTRVVASPLNYSGLTRDVRLPTPEAGNHTDEVATMLLLFTPGAPREDYFERVGTVASMTEEERAEFFLRHDTFWL